MGTMQDIAVEKASDKKTVKRAGETTSQDVDALRVLAQDAAQTDGAARPFMEPKTKTENEKKETRGRKSNAEREKIAAEKQGPPTPPPPQFNGADTLRPAFKVSSAFLVRFTGVPACALLPEEIEELSQTWGKLLEIYGPAFLAKHGPLVAALMTTGMVSLRISNELDKEIKKRQAERKKFGGVTGPQPVKTPEREVNPEPVNV